MRYGLIGEKLGHSFSKEIHEKLADYTYDLIPLSTSEFKEFMEKKKFTAINVTIPYKKDVIPYLDEIDPHAKEIGAVNTIVNRNGKLCGYNTDFTGFLYMVKQHHVQMLDKKVLIIGNGGASAAIQAVVKHELAKEIVIVKVHAGNGAISYEECFAKHLDAQIIINTSPCGMYPNIGDNPMDIAKFANCEAVMDIIYNPLLTRFCLQAKDKAIPYVMGLEMLIAQAKQSVEYFLDKSIEDQKIDDIYQDMIKERYNIVLIGMPSAGKTTIGKMLQEDMQKEFIDMDDVIVEKAGKSIPEIFEESKEEGFRALETNVAMQLAKENNKIIATGGGCIKNKANMDYLRQNGIIIFIDRDVNKLISSDPNRPLSKNKNTIQQLYEERYPLYMKYADCVAINNTGTKKTLQEIKEAYQRILLASNTIRKEEMK